MDTTSRNAIDPHTLKKVRQLLTHCHLEEFAAVAKIVRLKDLPVRDLGRELLDQLSLTAHEEAYPSHVRRSFPGVMGALQAGAHLKENERALPLVQCLWYAGQEARSKPFPLSKVPAVRRKFSAEELRTALSLGNFEEVIGWMRASMENAADFREARETLLSRAFRDITNLGHKFIFMQKTSELYEMFEDGNYPWLIPAVHYLMIAPTDTEYFKLLETKFERLDLDVTRFLENKAKVSDDEARRLERIVICQYPALIIENFVHALREGAAVEDLFQVTLMAASQCLLSAYKENWIYAVHAYNYAHEAWECFRRMENPLDRVYLPFMAALFVNKMGVECINPHKHARFEDLEPSPDEVTIKGLETAIGDSKPNVAAALIIRLLEGGHQFPSLARHLVLAAVKNDGGVCFGLDTEYCHDVLSDYPRLRFPTRTKLMTALAYFLAQVEKDYELHEALSHG